MTVLKLCVVVSATALLGAGPFACTPAQKRDARTAVDDLTKGCASGVPQSVAAIVDPASGDVVAIACATEEELAPFVQQILAARKAKAARSAPACGSGSAGPTTVLVTPPAASTIAPALAPSSAPSGAKK